MHLRTAKLEAADKIIKIYINFCSYENIFID